MVLKKIDLSPERVKNFTDYEVAILTLFNESIDEISKEKNIGGNKKD